MVWSSFADWVTKLLGMSREVERHGTAIEGLKDRVRNLEETLKLLAQQQQHRDELAALERDKLMLTLENEFARRERSLPAPREKKAK